MAWGWWKKFKDKLKGAWDKVKGFVGKVVGKVGKVAKPIADTAVKLAPVIGGAVGAAYGNPSAGTQIGNIVQSVGSALGLGK